MADDNLLLPNDKADSRIALLPADLAKPSNGQWNGEAVAPPSTGSDLTMYLHALRRHWLMALGIGLLCAAIAGPAVWFGVGIKYTAVSHLRVAMQEDVLLYNKEAYPDRERFEIYKNTQQQLLVSRFVLLSA